MTHLLKFNVTSSPKFGTSVIFFICLFLVSCKVQLVDNYDAALVKQIEETQFLTYKLYAKMKEEAIRSGANYLDYVDSYIEVEARLKSIYEKSKIKQLNKESTRNAEILLQKWRKYKEEHRQSENYNVGDIKITEVYIDGFFNALLIGERIKENLETEN